MKAMAYKIVSISVLTLLTFEILYAQLPKTQVYLAEFADWSSQPQLKALRYLTNFNHNGYNNQAKFANADELYMSAAIDSAHQTDILHFDLRRRTVDKFTNTLKISEFSPIIAPDQINLTTVRIESDGQDQSLWSYPLDRSNMGYRLFPKITNIGYYTWISRDTVAMFLVGNPHQLVLGNVKSGATEFLTDNIGRCIKSIPNGYLYFVHKIRADLWVLKSYHFSDRATTTICQMPSGKEDFDILPSGHILIGDGSQIKWLHPNNDKTWKIVKDFKDMGIFNIQRPTVFGNKILFIETSKP